MQNKWMYIGENIDHDSHTQELLDNLSKSCDFFISFSSAQDYNQFGALKLLSYYESLISTQQINVLWVSPGDSCRIHPRWLFQLRTRLPDLKIITCFSDAEHTFECNDKFFAQTADSSLVHGCANISRFHMLNLNATGGQIFDFNLYAKYRREGKKQIDISFIGGVYRSNRYAYLQALKENEIEVNVAGFGSDTGWIDRESALNLIARSRIHLNFSGVCSNYQEIDSRMSQFKGRIIESILLDSIPVTQYDPSTEIMFGDRYALLNVFHDEGELLEILKNISENLAEQQRNTTLLREFVLKEFDPERIIAELVSPIYKFKIKPTCYIDPIFGQRFIQARFFYLGKFLVGLRMHNVIAEMQLITADIKFSNWKMIYHFLRGLWHGVRLIPSRKKP